MFIVDETMKTKKRRSGVIDTAEELTPNFVVDKRRTIFQRP